MLRAPTRSRLAHATRASSISPPAHQSRFWLEATLLLLVFGAALYGAAQWPHPEWALLALLDYLWLCTLVFRYEPRGTVLMLPQLINIASAMVALVMIERGGEMFELGIVGRPGPWSNALNIYNLAFCAGVVFTLRPLLRLMGRKGAEGGLTPIFDRYAGMIAWITLILVGAVALALIVRGLQFGFPLLNGTDRFFFRRFAADKITLYALNLKFVLGYALGFVAFVIPVRKPMRILAGVAFALLMAIFFLFGDKFFTQLAAASAFAAPYLYRHHAMIRRRALLFAATGTLALSLVMGVTTYIYSQGFTETRAATSKRLSDRIVGQGELWYLQASIGAPLLHWNGQLVDRYLQSLTVKAIDLYAMQNSLGANYFSNRYAPDYLRASLQRNAGTVTYTEVNPAMGVALFGWLGGAIMMGAIGVVLGLACAYVAFAIESRSILSGLFSAYIFSQLRSSIVQAAPWVVASVYSLRWLAIILTIEVGLQFVGRAGAPSRARQHRTGRRPLRARKQPS